MATTDIIAATVTIQRTTPEGIVPVKASFTWQAFESGDEWVLTGAFDAYGQRVTLTGTERDFAYCLARAGAHDKT